MSLPMPSFPNDCARPFDHLGYAKVITDFFDQVKSRSKGYASMEYQLLEWRDEDLVRLDIKINGEDAPPLSTVCHKDQAHGRGKGVSLVILIHEQRRNARPSFTVQNLILHFL